MGADIIIAVDISSPLQDKEALGNSIAVLQQLSKFLTLQNIEEQKELLSWQAERTKIKNERTRVLDRIPISFVTFHVKGFGVI